ncbi:neurotransmitter-gated ion-channel ligand-binding protein [Alsobacter sp. KACC 23698]|uniref:Neurotransmitter-gated ion-channel ligand-binding protein n=1 Tax=Alsobacter sp. KACC 23698 TaxID=3149229 RepID=A0AAU7JCZ2_9HYPH
MTRLASLVLAASLLVASAVAALAQAPGAAAAPPPLPAGVERPLEVRMSVRVLNVTRIQEVQSEAGALVEFTQRWVDPTQRFDRVEAGAERIDWVGDEAEARLARIWNPGVAIENQIGRPRAQTTALSIFHDGRVTLIRRVDADLRVDLGMGAFPFDHQSIALRFSSARHPASDVVLVTTELDRGFSTIERNLSVTNWLAGSIAFRNETFFGWNAQPYARLVAVATVDRSWPRYILRLFVPFFALMSLSLFILWAPDSVISQKDRAPMIFSSLLALAALSFTFESSFPGSISLNSPVASMISLGYFYLPLVLLIDLMLSQTGSRLARRYPALLPEIKRNVRVTAPLLFFGLCILLVLVSGDDAARLY